MCDLLFNVFCSELRYNRLDDLRGYYAREKSGSKQRLEVSARTTCLAITQTFKSSQIYWTRSTEMGVVSRKKRDLLWKKAVDRMVYVEDVIQKVDVG